MFVYDIMTCWDKKNHVLEAKNAIFLDLTEAACVGNFLGMFFMFLEKTLP
jgi:hypothetical protein